MPDGPPGVFSHTKEIQGDDQVLNGRHHYKQKSKDNGRLEKVSAAQQIEESLISLIIQRTYTNCY